MNDLNLAIIDLDDDKSGDGLGHANDIFKEKVAIYCNSTTEADTHHLRNTVSTSLISLYGHSAAAAAAASAAAAAALKELCQPY